MILVKTTRLTNRCCRDIPTFYHRQLRKSFNAYFRSRDVQQERSVFQDTVTFLRLYSLIYRYVGFLRIIILYQNIIIRQILFKKVFSVWLKAFVNVYLLFISELFGAIGCEVVIVEVIIVKIKCAFTLVTR